MSKNVATIFILLPGIRNSHRFCVPFFVIIAGNFFFPEYFFLFFSHLLMINGHPQRQARDQDKKVKKNLKK